MTEGTTALTLLCVGLALMIPVACWFGIGIGEERARQQYRMAQQNIEIGTAIHSAVERFNDNDIDAQRDWGGRR